MSYSHLNNDVETQALRCAELQRSTTLHLYPRRKSSRAHANIFRNHFLSALLGQPVLAYGESHTKANHRLDCAAQDHGYRIIEVNMRDYQ